MFKPVSLFIGLRYTQAKKRNHFISFISLMSMLGIALGVLVLITVLSVMNGFDREIKKRVFGMVPPITIGSRYGNVSDWQSAAAAIKKIPEVTSVAPFVSGQVLITNSGYVMPAIVNGIDPAKDQKIFTLNDKLTEGDAASIHNAKQFNIILGEDLANRLNASIGDKITVVTPQATISLAGVIPRFKRFTVSGIFKAGNGFGFDTSFAFINLQDAQKLFELGKSVSGLHASMQDVYAAPAIATDIAIALGNNARVTDWTEQYGAFFHAVSLEKTMMFFILMLIIAVAVFNLVCTLVMVVNDKESDIAILRTFGATPRMVMGIFIVQGAIVGVVGTLLGIIGGIALAYNVTEIVNYIEHIFHVKFLSGNAFFVNYLPSQLLWSDVWHISVSALLLSLIATIYPAFRASRTEIVEALRYE